MGQQWLIDAKKKNHPSDARCKHDNRNTTVMQDLNIRGPTWTGVGSGG